MRQVCGRLKSDYRYSKDIVYNNFPFPKEPTDKQRFKNELERLEFLFDLYRKYTEPLTVIEEKETRRIKRKPKAET